MKQINRNCFDKKKKNFFKKIPVISAFMTDIPPKEEIKTNIGNLFTISIYWIHCNSISTALKIDFINLDSIHGNF